MTSLRERTKSLFWACMQPETEKLTTLILNSNNDIQCNRWDTIRDKGIYKEEEKQI